MNCLIFSSFIKFWRNRAGTSLSFWSKQTANDVLNCFVFSLCRDKSLNFRQKNKTLENIINVRAFSHLSCQQLRRPRLQLQLVSLLFIIFRRRMDFEKKMSKDDISIVEEKKTGAIPTRNRKCSRSDLTEIYFDLSNWYVKCLKLNRNVIDRQTLEKVSRKFC